MMKNLKLIIVFIIVLISGLVAYRVFQDSDSEQSASPTSTNNSDTSEVNTAGKYIDYSSGLLADSTLGRKILFFHAPWCSQCEKLDNSISNGDIPSGVTIIKVDFDGNQDLRSKYGVTIQTTMVEIDNQGELVKKFVAYDEPSLDAVIKNLP